MEVRFAMIEEMIFYPACKPHAEEDMLDEAYVEHDGAKVLIAELSQGSPDDHFYNAKVKVLSELIKHCSYLMTLREMLGQEKTRKHFCLCLGYAWSARGREKSKRMDE